MWLFFPNQLNLSTKHIFSPSPPHQGHSRDGREKGREREPQTNVLTWDSRLDGNAPVMGQSPPRRAPREPAGTSRASGMGRQREPEVLGGAGQELVPDTPQFICWLSAIRELEESAHHSTSSQSPAAQPSPPAAASGWLSRQRDISKEHGWC